MDKYIDLHIHSNNSDGKLTIGDIINYANLNNVGTLSITDHDCYMEMETLNKYDNLGIIIPGMELSTDYYIGERKVRIHLLGYAFDDSDGEIKGILQKMAEARAIGNKTYIEELIKRFEFLSEEDFSGFQYSSYGRLKKLILNFIDMSKYNEEEKNMINICLSNIKPIYPKCTLDTKMAIDLIKRHKGFSCFAHPYQTHLSDEELEKVIEDLTESGLDAIEIFHSGAKIEETEFAKKMAKKYHLLESCGSDFHSIEENPPIEIGKGINDNLCIHKISLADRIIKRDKNIIKGREIDER